MAAEQAARREVFQEQVQKDRDLVAEHRRQVLEKMDEQTELLRMIVAQTDPFRHPYRRKG